MMSQVVQDFFRQRYVHAFSMVFELLLAEIHRRSSKFFPFHLLLKDVDGVGAAEVLVGVVHGAQLVGRQGAHQGHQHGIVGEEAEGAEGGPKDGDPATEEPFRK